MAWGTQERDSQPSRVEKGARMSTNDCLTYYAMLPSPRQCCLPRRDSNQEQAYEHA